MTAPTLTYSRAQIVLHWATLLLLIAAFVTHDAMKDALRARAPMPRRRDRSRMR